MKTFYLEELNKILSEGEMATTVYLVVMVMIVFLEIQEMIVFLGRQVTIA